MESVAVEQNIGTVPSAQPILRRESLPRTWASDELLHLAAWVSGLESFLSGGGWMLGDGASFPSEDRHIQELRLARSGLQRCSRITQRILASIPELDRAECFGQTNLSAGELVDFALALRGPLMQAETLNRSETLAAGEWLAWCTVFLKAFDDIPAFPKLIALTDSSGERYIPEALTNVLRAGKNPVEGNEMATILPRFGRILGLLNIIGEMLETDEPLRPALLIFSKVSEQTQELISYLNHRIERSASSNEEFVSLLDGASYTASLELKKVLNQELVGITSIRPATTVYARTEAAHALLTESFQHILTGFAKQFDADVDAFTLFPSFSVKLTKSRTLRNELYAILRLVQAAESNPDKRNISVLNAALLKYMDEALGYLFYKDTETFERFVEEILVTRQKKDLVPILHRFGAYLETLFAQVNMRAVLEGHPFEAQDGTDH